METKNRFGFLKYAVWVIGLTILALLIIDFNNRLTEWRNLTDRRNQVAVELNQHVQTQISLETKIAYATSPAGVEEWAYEDASMARKGEVLVVPLPSGDSKPAPTPSPEPEKKVTLLEKVHNWQLWLALFFDPQSGK